MSAKCDGCGTRHVDTKRVQLRVEGPEVLFERKSVRWCFHCRRRNHGFWRYEKPGVALDTTTRGADVIYDE